MSEKRLAVVTGGMGGLGESISTKMADAGYRVVVTYSPSNTKWKSWLENMKQQGYSFSAYPIDVADFDDSETKCAQIAKDCGAIDILVNNAGITRDMTFKKMSKADWDAVMRTNLDSCFNMTKQVMDGMVERDWGRVINVSSVNGQKGAFGQTNYSAAKAGIHGFTKALALEVARKNVTINTISPGYIGTKMVTAIPKDILDSKILPQIPIGRLGKPDEVAGLIIYLCSEEAAFVTGRQHFDQRRSAHVLRRIRPGAPATRGSPMEQQVRLIKKYPNRRLYDTKTSSYITLADVKQMVLKQEELPGRRREDERRSDAPDLAADHSRRRIGRHADVLRRSAVADDPVLR